MGSTDIKLIIMTVNHYISQVFDGTNISTDDSGIRKRFVYAELLATRAELVKQEFNKFRLYDGAQSQTLPDFALRLTDIGGADYHNNYSVMRSVKKVPSIIQHENGLAIDGIFLKNGRTLTFTDKGTWFSKKGRRFTRRDSNLYAFIDKGFLVVDDFTDLMELNVDIHAYFYDPVSVGILGGSACTAAFDYDMFIPGHIERRTIEITRAVIFRRLGIPTDVENNSKLDIQSNVRNQVQPDATRFSQST